MGDSGWIVNPEVIHMNEKSPARRSDLGGPTEPLSLRRFSSQFYLGFEEAGPGEHTGGLPHCSGVPRPKLLILAELLKVLGGGAAVAGRDLFGAGAADGAGGFIHLAAQLHFDLLGGGQDRGLDALREHRVVGVGVGVQVAELLNELADVVSGRRVIAILLLELLQALHGVAVLGLVVGDLEVAEAGLRIDDAGAAIVAAVVGAAVIGSAIAGATAAAVGSKVAATLAAAILLALTLALTLSLSLLSLLSLALLALTLLPLLSLSLPALALLTLAAAGALLLQHLAEAFQIG